MRTLWLLILALCLARDGSGEQCFRCIDPAPGNEPYELDEVQSLAAIKTVTVQCIVASLVGPMHRCAIFLRLVETCVYVRIYPLSCAYPCTQNI